MNSHHVDESVLKRSLENEINIRLQQAKEEEKEKNK